MVNSMEKFDTNYFTKLTEMLQDNNVINLAVGQPDFKPPISILKALEENIGTDTGYTPIQGLEELRKLIRKKLRTENGIKAEKVVVTVGATEAIFDSMLAHLNYDSEVILFSPYYSKYIAVPCLLGVKTRTIPLKNGRPDLLELEHKITKRTKMVVVNSPSNPTGIVYSKDEIRQLVKIIDKHDLILLSDEVYEKYVYDGKKHISPGKYSERVITVNSFSKTYGFPGLRLGYLAGTEEMVAPILDVHMSNTTCSPYASQKAAIAALRIGYDFFDITSFDKRRKLVMKKLDEIGIEYIYPDGAFYVYICVGGDSFELADKLMHKKILVMPSQLFGDENNSIRISYATDRKTLVKGLELLIKNLSPPRYNS